MPQRLSLARHSGSSSDTIATPRPAGRRFSALKPAKYLDFGDFEGSAGFGAFVKPESFAWER
jgi:hypothetical protein